MYIHLIVSALVLLLEEFLQPINEESTSYLQSTSNIIKYCTAPWIFRAICYSPVQETLHFLVFISLSCVEGEKLKNPFRTQEAH